MKKIFSMLLTLALIMAMGSTAVNAVTSGAFGGSSGSGSSFMGVDLGGYVNNDVYKWKCNETTYKCEKVKQATIKPSEVYADTEALCKAKCPKDSSPAYTGGGSGTGTGTGIATGLASGLFGNSLPSKQPGATGGTTQTYSGTSGVGGSATGGLSDFKLSAPSGAAGLNGTNNVAGLNGASNLGTANNFGVNFGAPGANSLGGLGAPSLFGTGVEFGRTGTSNLSPQGGPTNPAGPAAGLNVDGGKWSFGGLLQSWFGNSGDDAQPDAVILPNDADYKDFDFTATSSGGSVSDAKGVLKITMGETVTLEWNAQADSFSKAGCKAIANTSIKEWPEANIGLKGEKTISETSLITSKTGGIKTYNFSIECPLLVKDKEVKKTIRVTVAKQEGESGEAEFKSFTATPDSIKWDASKKITSVLKWTTTGFTSCSTSAVAGTDWKTNIKTSSQQTVTFDGVKDYTFKITCTPAKGDVVYKEVTVKVTAKDGTSPTDDLNDYNKWSQEERRFINNDCRIGFVNPSLTSDNGFINKDTKTINAVFNVSCGSVRAKKEIVNGETKITSGFDARMLSHGIEIHIANSNNFNNDVNICSEISSAGPIAEKTGNGYNISCNISSDLKSKIARAIDDNQIIKAFAFVNYKTNEITGSNYSGREHTQLLRVTTDRIKVGTGSKTPPPTTTTTTAPGGSGKAGAGEVKLTYEMIEAVGCDRTMRLTWSAGPEFQSCKATTTPAGKTSGEWKGEFKTLSGTTPKIILFGSEKQDSEFKFELTCIDSFATHVSAKPVNITVLQCGASGKDKWKETCDKIKNNGKCAITLGLGNQVVLTKDTKKGWTASDLRFNVTLSEGCDVGKFQKSFARIIIDKKIIQDISLANTANSREFSIPNIWDKLDPWTQGNISREITENGKDGVTINAYLEAWSTFDENAGRDEKGKLLDAQASKNANCNWTNPPRAKPLAFVKYQPPKPPAGGEGAGTPTTTKPQEEEPKTGNKNFKGTGLALYFPQNELCTIGYSEGDIDKYEFKQKASLFLMLSSIGGTSAWEVNWAGIWVLNKDIVYLKPQDFENSSKEVNERGWYINNSMKPGPYTLAIFCRDKNNIKGVTNEGAFGSSEYREFTVRNNEMSEVSIPDQKGGTVISEDSLDIKAEMIGRKDTVGAEIRVTLVGTEVNDPDATCLVAIKGEKYDPKKMQFRKTLKEIKDGAVISTFMFKTTQDVYVQLRCFSGNTIYFSKTITKNINQKITSDSGQVCKAGSPTFTYYKGTGESSSGIPCVSINTSNCCFRQVVKAQIWYLGRSALDWNTWGNNKKYSFCSTVNDPTDETGKTSEIKLCLSSSPAMRGSTSGCTNYCIFRNKNGKTTTECSLEGDFMCR